MKKIRAEPKGSFYFTKIAPALTPVTAPTIPS